MKQLKLTILVEPGKKGEVMNVFGSDYQLVGRKCKFMQYTFSDVIMFAPFKLAPILQLLQTLEQTTGSLRYKMFHLQDEKDYSYAPVYFECLRDEWSRVQAKTQYSEKSNSNLLSLLN